LIKNRVKLPLFGKSIQVNARTKTSTSKRHYLLNKGLFSPNDIKKYVLDLSSNSNKMVNEVGSKIIAMDNNSTLPDKMKPTPIMQNRTGAESFDSESELHINANAQE